MGKFKETEFGTIPADWDVKTILELKADEKSAIAMGPFGSNIKAENFVPKGVPVIRGTNLNYDKYVDGEFVFLTDEKADELKGSNCTAGDLVFTHRGTIGQVGLIPEGKYPRYVISQSGMKLTVDKTKINNEFLFYFFKSKYGQYQLLKSEGQVGVPSISNPLTTLKSLEVPVPPLNEQNSIADTLSSIDSKIDLLNNENVVLEELAELLFTKRFIEDAGESWDIGTLEHEFDFIMGQSPEGKTLNENKIGLVFYQGRSDFGFRFPQPRVYTTAPTRIAKPLDTLVSVRAPVGDMNMAIEECALGRGVAAFRYRNNNNYYSYTYYKLRSLMGQIKQFEDNGSVFGSIGKEDFKKLENVLPPVEIIQKFQAEVKALDDKIIENTNQVRALIMLRDTLLSKLMSGEARVIL